MDGSQFDNMARAMWRSGDRRGFLKGLIAVAAAAIGIGAGRTFVDAARQCKTAGGVCAASGDCCRGLSCVNGTCCASANVCGGTCCTSPLNGVATCVNGVCTYTCNAGFALCGSKCVSTAQGSCCFGYDCADDVPNSTGFCVNNVCQYTCNDGFIWMNGTCVGCPSGTTCKGVCCDVPKNATGYCSPKCGWGCNADYRTCGEACVPRLGCCITDECSVQPNADVVCTDGACVYTCKPGFAACDGNTANGCEINLMNDVANCGACGATCAAGETCCNGVCANLQTDEGYCGACGVSCGEGQICCGGVCRDGNCCADNQCDAADNASVACVNWNCAYTCDAGWDNCDGDMLGTGCESELATDVDNCGVCGNDCGDGVTCCSGECHDLQTDEGHCGACGQACEAGLDCCGGGCFDLQTSEDHCGACGVSCGEGQICCGGVCRDGDCCADDQCAVVDHAAVACVNWNCAYTCAADWDNCDGDMLANGCETDLTSLEDCGVCGNDCTGTAPANGVDRCVEGYCTFDCADGYKLCGDQCIDANACCFDADCGDGLFCRDGVCACRYRTCGDVCCGAGEICSQGACVTP